VSDHKSVKAVQAAPKVYIEIVKQLRNMIAVDQLKTGDRLPSERELSERLNVARSSVREALRALELLGLIETRRGEGTFINNFKENKLVQLLGTFVMQDEKSIMDVQETKNLIEMDSLRLVLNRAEHGSIEAVRRWGESHSFSDDEFFYKIVELSGNQVLLKIWNIITEYHHTFQLDRGKVEREEYIQLVHFLLIRDEMKVQETYQHIRGIVE
jgi:GntR family transcriptional regulator, transcriptional repressor for pyruvate dehydrogenase complex